MSSTIYYFPLDEEQKETLPPVTIVLKEDGSADLSKLPKDVRDHLEIFGVPNITHMDTVYAKDGELFLATLLASDNTYWRFRQSPEPRQ